RRPTPRRRASRPPPAVPCCPSWSNACRDPKATCFASMPRWRTSLPAIPRTTARASMRSSKPKRGAYPSSTCGATTASRRTTGTGPETEPPASGFFTLTFRAPDMTTLTMLTRNSSRFVEKALAALAGFDEILVLDNGSTDDTMEIARRFPNVQLIEHEFIGFGPLKNLAADAARNDWILNVDSDEIMTPE